MRAKYERRVIDNLWDLKLVSILYTEKSLGELSC